MDLKPDASYSLRIHKQFVSHYMTRAMFGFGILINKILPSPGFLSAKRCFYH